MLCLYRGFDGLDVSFAARIDYGLCAALEAARSQAQDTRRAAYLTWSGISLEVAESGAKGGYAFRCSTGAELGIVWFFKRPTRGDPWGIRASCRSFGLATKGLGGMRAELYSIMDALGVIPSGEGESIGRVDYAIDLLVPGFQLVPQNFVMHSNTNRADHIEPMSVNGRSGRVSSVTIGTMPGRQVIVYDKRAEVIAKGKPAWWAIWNSALHQLDRPTLDPSDLEGCSVWRVELRAGKKHLKDGWGIRTWTDLDTRLGNVMSSMLDAIRYALDSGDSNRSRWPDSELWRAVHLEVVDDLFEMRCSIAPDLVKRVQLEAHDQLLAMQMAGLLTTRAALHELVLSDLPSFALSVGKEMSNRVTEAPAHFDEKLTSAKARYDVEHPRGS
jgi:hypothetical protein